MKELKEQYDRMTALWNEAERQLKEIHLPTSCRVVAWKTEEEEVFLSWTKHGKDYRLCLEMESGLDAFSCRALCECSVLERMKCINIFYSLKNKMEEEAIKFAKELAKANDALETFTSAGAETC